MGWWSATVMGGDTPLDARDTVLFDILEMDVDKFFEDEYTPAMIKDMLMENLDHIQARDWDDEVQYQAIGALLMEYGMPADDMRVENILAQARTSAQSDDWAFSDKERKGFMTAFIAQIDEYDGKSTEIASEGLFEVMATALESGTKGLINKNI